MNNENMLEYNEMVLATNVLENVCNMECIQEYQKRQIDHVINALKKCMNENVDIKKFVE